MARDARDRREAPEPEPPGAAAVDRPQQREVRERAREEEQAVHPAVDAVEQQHPARRDEHGRDQPDGAAREPRDEQRDQRQARQREERRAEPERGQAAAGVRRDRGEEIVQRRAASLLEHDVEQPAERLTADEERERLVLVRRPRGQPRKEKGGDGEHAAGDAPREPRRPNSDPGRARRALRSRRDLCHDETVPAEHAASLAGCRSTNTAAPTGTCSRSSSGWTTLRQRSARSAARRRSSVCSTPSRSTTRARGSTRPTTGARASAAAARSRATAAVAARSRRSSKSESKSSESKSEKSGGGD